MHLSKPNLLLLHGALGSSKTFDLFIESISSSFNPITFDFRGHGIYAQDTHISTEILSLQLIEFIEINNLKSVCVFGYSMGGYIALMACFKRPDLFDKVITLATKFDWNIETVKKEIGLLQTLKNLPVDHPFLKQLELFHTKDNINTCFQGVEQVMLELGSSNFLNSASLNQIKNNVHLLLGEMDTMVSIEETKAVVNALPFAQLTILPNTKHPFEKVNPMDLLEIIKKFTL